MLVKIFGMWLFVTGIHTPPDHSKGCYIDVKEHNTYYVTGASCGEVMEQIDLTPRNKRNVKMG